MMSHFWGEGFESNEEQIEAIEKERDFWHKQTEEILSHITGELHSFSYPIEDGIYPSVIALAIEQGRDIYVQELQKKYAKLMEMHATLIVALGKRYGIDVSFDELRNFLSISTSEDGSEVRGKDKLSEVEKENQTLGIKI